MTSSLPVAVDPSDRVLVLGDIGGQFDVFTRTLRRLGIDPEHPVLPAGMTLIQVGDINRINPSPALREAECVDLANRLLALNPARYMQLFGNHELGAIGAGYPVSVAGHENPTLDSWWWDRRAHLAAGIVTADGTDILVTHAGLTRGQWTDRGRPDLEMVVP
jgi:hypothetical protein